MKTKFCILLILVTGVFARAQTNDLTTLLQQGLMDEQANRNLDAAIADYQSLATQFDKDRQVAATAVFRLGECYRMLGKTNEAVAEYQRVLHDFPDQTMLATLSRQDLAGLGSAPATEGSAPAIEPATAENDAAGLWDKLKGLPMEKLENVLPTLILDPLLTSLLQQRDEEQIKLAQLQKDFAPENPNMKNEMAVRDAIQKQISDRIEGIMESLKIKAEISPASTEAAVPAGEEDQEIQRLKEKFQESPDLINAEVDGLTPLARAISAGQLRVATYLLDHGADVNYGPQRTSPLFLAARTGQKAMVELLLSRGADVNVKLGGIGGTALYIAASQGFQSVAEALLAKHATVDAADSNGVTPLGAAAMNGQESMVQMLLAAGANPNAKDNYGETPLSWAVQKSYVEIMKALLAAGANPNTEDRDGRTPLSFAAGNAATDAVKILLAAKADPNAGTVDAPLLRAVNNKNLATAELLLKAGANPNVKNVVNGYQTTLSAAISADQLPMVQLLLKYKADPNGLAYGGQPLIFSTLSDTNILETLLDGGAKADATSVDEAHETPLCIAASQNYVSAVEILLKHGANPNVRTEHDWTPLHYAAWNLASSNVFELLLDYKANPNVHNSDAARTPLDEIKVKQGILPANQMERVHVYASPEQKATAVQLADLLRQHGALDNPPDWNSIQVSCPNFTDPIFRRGTNDWNQFTLLEAISVAFYRNAAYFPDFQRISVLRPNSTGTASQPIAVDLLNSTNGVDFAKDIPLEFGDVVKIPEREHTLAEADNRGPNEIEAIRNYLREKAGEAKLIVDGGQTIQLPLKDAAGMSVDTGVYYVNGLLRSPTAWNVLLSDSDLSRVKVTRHDTESGKISEWIVDCTSNNPNDWPQLRLRDGDVIEVPERR